MKYTSKIACLANESKCMEGVATPTVRAFSVGEFCRRYGIGRTHAYALISQKRLRAVKVGSRTLIIHEAAEAWLAALPELDTSPATSTSHFAVRADAKAGSKMPKRS